METPHTFSGNSTLTIHRSDSDLISHFYQMKTPYLMTYEFCSGAEPDDYINIITLSENDCEICQETFMSHDDYYKNHPSHFHDYFELMIVLDGTITQRIENRDYKYDAGSCCLINRSLCHFENFDSSATLVFIGLSTEFIQELFEGAERSPYTEESAILKSALFDFIKEDTASPGKKAYLDFIPTLRNSTSLSFLHRMIQDMIMCIVNPGFGTDMIVRGTICRILSYISDSEYYHCTLTSLDKSSDFLIFMRIGHILEENYGRVSRRKLSETLNYSGDYLNRIVSKYTGMCLSDYGMEFSLKRAAEMLKNTNESISEIAMNLGFTNRTFFYKFFSEKYGMTPGDYRKAHRTNAL